MKKTKKTKIKKAPKQKSLLGGAAKSLKKLGLQKLSTTQKVVGGTALVALGLSYLAKRRSAASATSGADIDANTGATLGSTEGATI